jgi:hypothetical protein
MGTPSGRGSSTLAAVAPFAPPANVDDLNESRRQGWSAVVSAWLDGAVERVTAEVGDPEQVRFVNPARTPPPAEPAERKIVWDAFPRVISVRHPGDPTAARAAADEPDDLGNYFGVRFFEVRDGREEEVILPFRRHDEYCEWFVETDPATGRPGRYVFTCEGPEYWQFIAGGTAAVVDPATVPAPARVDGDRALLLRLYRALVGPQVAEADLFHQADVLYRVDDGTDRIYRTAGEYNPNNKWNTTHGAVHLTHPSNTLSAEIFLGADASVPRTGANGASVTDAAELICCARYGEPNRSSDPTIGADVNDLVRSGLSVSLRDPIGLYLDGLDTTGLSGPNGEDVSNWWRIVRGADRQILRAEFAAPEDSSFGLDDVLVNGVALTRAGQLAELITVSLYGIGADFGNGAPTPIGCSGHCCAQVDNPDLLQILPVADRCPDGWTEAFPQSTTEGTAAAAVTDARRFSGTGSAPLAVAMTYLGRRPPRLSEGPR